MRRRRSRRSRPRPPASARAGSRPSRPARPAATAPTTRSARSRPRASRYLHPADLRKMVAMSRHAGPPSSSDTPPVPEPTFAERARTLVHLGRTGTLATLSRKHSGFPFASIMPYALDGDGRPLFLISSMAMHTQNLEADARASLLVTQPGTTGDPLAAGRVTLMGRAARVSAAERETVKSTYLAAHANAAYWVDFEDFALDRKR